MWFMFYMDDFFTLLKSYRQIQLQEHDRVTVEVVLRNTLHKALHYLDVGGLAGLDPQPGFRDWEVCLDFDWTSKEVVISPGNDDTVKLFALYEELLLARELGKS